MTVGARIGQYTLGHGIQSVKGLASALTPDLRRIALRRSA